MADPLAYMLDEATKRMEALYGENRRIETAPMTRRAP